MQSNKVVSFTLRQQELNKESECTNLAVKKYSILSMLTVYYFPICNTYVETK